jgi:site-specific recombinase XerD
LSSPVTELAVIERVPVMDLAVMMRHIEMALRDGTWRKSPVGYEVSRYLRALRWGGATDNTLEAYTHVLGMLALRHADWASLEEFCSASGTEYIREFLDAEWGSAAPATKRQRSAIVRSFFRQAALERRIPYDPAATIRGPKERRRAARQAYALHILYGLVAAQESDRDQCALELLCLLGLRKNELRVLRIRDIDFVRSLIVVHGKGGKTELLPLVGTVRDSLYLHIQGEGRTGGEYLLYPRIDRMRPMDAASIHRWFKRCLERAGLPVTVKMHELRHSAADALRRESNVVMAKELLRHENIATTEAYLHPTKSELAAALLLLDEAWQGAK